MFGLGQFSMFLNSFAFPARTVIMDQTSLKLIFKLHLVDYNRPILNDSFEIGSWWGPLIDTGEGVRRKKSVIGFASMFAHMCPSLL